MEYVQATLGRVYFIKLEDGEDIFDQLKCLIKTENIRAGYVNLLGATTKSKVVLGPHKREYPPNPFWWEFDDARELFAFGIFAWEDDEPKLHLHSGIGHNSESRVGCIRGMSEVYITVEAVLQEVVNPDIKRKLDSRYNASLISFE